MRAMTILTIEYEVDALTPSDPAVMVMDTATNEMLNELCRAVLGAGVRAGRVRAFTVPLPDEATS